MYNGKYNKIIAASVTSFLFIFFHWGTITKKKLKYYQGFLYWGKSKVYALLLKSSQSVWISKIFKRVTSDFWASGTWCVHAIDKSVAIEWIFLGDFIWCVSVSPPVSIVSRKAVRKWRWCTLILMLIYYIFFPAGIYLLKVNKRNTRTRCETCSKFTIKISERRQTSFWCLYS